MLPRLVFFLAALAIDARSSQFVPDYIFWVHLPKCGTSFGNVLVHHANRSLPLDARMPTCDKYLLHHNESTDRTHYILTHPYEPHVCSGATDVFFKLYPHQTWFRGWFVGTCDAFEGQPASGTCDAGEHRKLTMSRWTAHRGHFQGLFRDPYRWKVSKYIKDTVPRGRIQGPANYLNFSKPEGADSLLKYARGHKGDMIRFVLGEERSAQLTAESVNMAIRRLRGFSFFGILEEWQASVCLYHRMIMGDRECLSVEFLNNRKTDIADEHLGVKVLKKAGFHDQYDLPFFQKAQEIFRSRLDRYDVTDKSCAAIRCTSNSWIYP